METKLRSPPDAMARACQGRRSNSPHRHRLQHETQFEDHRYGRIAGKNTTDAHTRASEDTAGAAGTDIFAHFPGKLKRSTKIKAKCFLRTGLIASWRRETTGRRDIELCQNVIEKFYEAEHKMNLLRSPLSYAHEGEGREREPYEDDKETERRNLLFVPLSRFNAQADFWSEFFSYRFRMRALFGARASDAFVPVDEAIRSFRATALTRYQALFLDPGGLSRETKREFDETIWAGSSQPDDIANKMSEGIRLMEAICVPIVRATRPSTRFCGWLNRYKLF